MSLQSRWQKLKLTTSNAGSVDPIDPCSNPQKTPNTACTGQVEVCAIFKQFSGFEFILLPSRVHARPSASTPQKHAGLSPKGDDVASRWAFESYPNSLI